MPSTSWQRRNDRARSLGYRNFYDYRAHDYGKLPPSAPRLRGGELRVARGHAGPADLQRLISRGRVSTMFQEPVGERDDAGRYREVRVTVQLNDGSQQRFRLRGRQLKADELEPLRAAVSAAGPDVYTNPSIDVLFLVDRDDVDEVDPWEYDDELEAE